MKSATAYLMGYWAGITMMLKPEQYPTIMHVSKSLYDAYESELSRIYRNSSSDTNSNNMGLAFKTCRLIPVEEPWSVKTVIYNTERS